METTFNPITRADRISELKSTEVNMIRIEIIRNGARNIIERDEVDVITSMEDLMNLLFISGTDIHELEESFVTISQDIKNKHKNEQQANQNPRTLGL